MVVCVKEPGQPNQEGRKQRPASLRPQARDQPDAHHKLWPFCARRAMRSAPYSAQASTGTQPDEEEHIDGDKAVAAALGDMR